MSRASIRKRLADATPGPWWLEPDRDGDSTQMLFVSCIHDDKHGEYGDPIADLWNRENRPLIAHAPSDIAALLAFADAAANVLGHFVVQADRDRYECRDCEADVTEASAFMRPLVHGDDCEVRPLIAALAALEAAE